MPFPSGGADNIDAYVDKLETEFVTNAIDMENVLQHIGAADRGRPGSARPGDRATCVSNNARCNTICTYAAATIITTTGREQGGPRR